jgi:hypothetical protein
MTSLIKDRTDKERQKTDLEINKPYTLFQCSKLMKGTDRADKYLS